jgi:hypothetical protein
MRAPYPNGAFDADTFLAFLEGTVAARSESWHPLLPVALHASPERNPAVHALRRECAFREAAFERRVARVLRRLLTLGRAKPAGRRPGTRNRPRTRSAEERRVQQLAPQLRTFIRTAKRLCLSGRHPRPALAGVVELIGAAPPSVEQIEHVFLKLGPPRRLTASPEAIVRWIVAKHLGIGLVAAKNLIKRTR